MLKLHRRARWAVGVVVLAAVLAIVLSACGDGHSAPSAATTSLPTATQSGQGSEAAAAKGFVRRWLAAEQRMRTTGHTAAYLAANPDCSDCATIARYVRTWYARGGYERWNGYRIRSMRFTPASGGGIMTVHALSTAETIKTSGTGKPNHLGAKKTMLYVRLAPKGGSYTVTSESEG